MYDVNKQDFNEAYKLLIRTRTELELLVSYPYRQLGNDYRNQRSLLRDVQTFLSRFDR